MLIGQIVAFSLVVFYLVFRTIEQPRPAHFLFRLALISAAGWMAEESSILLYNFYNYTPARSLFLGHVPVLVIVIWPLIIHSAWDLASQLLSSNSRHVPLAAAAVVCTDASLLEPVCVNAGLWSWNEPGIFGVPPIGILGWFYFAFLCILLFDWGNRQKKVKCHDLLILVIPLLGTHLLLLATWWGALRWVNMPVNSMVATGVAWAISIFLVAVVLRNRTGKRVNKKALLLRLPGAFCLFLWFALTPKSSELLVVYAVAFVPPYLTLMAQQYIPLRGKPLTLEIPH